MAIPRITSKVTIRVDVGTDESVIRNGAFKCPCKSRFV